MKSLLSHLDLLFSSTPLDGPEQMALDEVLLKEASRPLLRVYCWKSPCVTFGYFQRWQQVRAAFPEDTLVRRWSGGGCVEHGRDITFALIIPAREPAGKIAPSFFYERFHQALVEALQEFEFEARLIGPSETIEGEACFAAPALHDIVLENQKIVGGAQRRSAGSLLHQGSLHLPTREKNEEENKRIVKPLFTSLGMRLALAVAFTPEKQSWLEEAERVAAARYRTREWTQKR